MDFETLDWEFEAERVKRAFGVVQPVEFISNPNEPEHEKPFLRVLFAKSDEPTAWIPLTRVLTLSVKYLCDENGVGSDKCFHVFRTGTFDDYNGASLFSAGIDLNWNGEIVNRYHYFHPFAVDDTTPWYYPRFSLPLAQGLFHLGLLSPEIEEDLKISPTAHQKIEWTLEYERHYGF